MNVVENETIGHEVMKAAGFTHGGFYLSLSDEILEAVSTGLRTQMKQTTPVNE